MQVLAISSFYSINCKNEKQMMQLQHIIKYFESMSVQKIIYRTFWNKKAKMPLFFLKMSQFILNLFINFFFFLFNNSHQFQYNFMNFMNMMRAFIEFKMNNTFVLLSTFKSVYFITRCTT